MRLTLQGNADAPATITLTYARPGATWEPMHELRADPAHPAPARPAVFTPCPHVPRPNASHDHARVPPNACASVAAWARACGRAARVVGRRASARAGGRCCVRRGFVGVCVGRHIVEHPPRSRKPGVGIDKRRVDHVLAAMARDYLPWNDPPLDRGARPARPGVVTHAASPHAPSVAFPAFEPLRLCVDPFPDTLLAPFDALGATHASHRARTRAAITASCYARLLSANASRCRASAPVDLTASGMSPAPRCETLTQTSSFLPFVPETEPPRVAPSAPRTGAGITTPP